MQFDVSSSLVFLLRYDWESIDVQTEFSANTLNKEGCKKSSLWLGTFILNQYIIASQISFALSMRGKGQDKHLTFAIFVLLLFIGLFLQWNMSYLISKLQIGKWITIRRITYCLNVIFISRSFVIRLKFNHNIDNWNVRIYLCPL